MEKIVIGREGTQPFVIKGKKVSRMHCELTIDEDVWTLRDLGSSHGTFIRNRIDGNFIPITEDGTIIDPLTFICLGDDTSEGCTFYAYNIVHPGQYAPIFNYLRDKEDDFNREGEKLENKARIAKMALFAANAIVFVVSFPQVMPMSNDSRLMMLRFVPLLSTGLTAFYDPSKTRRHVEERRKRFRHCPNPLCSEMLSDKAIQQGRCRCMKK